MDKVEFLFNSILVVMVAFLIFALGVLAEQSIWVDSCKKMGKHLDRGTVYSCSVEKEK